MVKFKPFFDETVLHLAKKHDDQRVSARLTGHQTSIHQQQKTVDHFLKNKLRFG